MFTRAFASHTRASEPRKGPGYEVDYDAALLSKAKHYVGNILTTINNINFINYQASVVGKEPNAHYIDYTVQCGMD